MSSELKMLSYTMEQTPIEFIDIPFSESASCQFRIDDKSKSPAHSLSIEVNQYKQYICANGLSLTKKFLRNLHQIYPLKVPWIIIILSLVQVAHETDES